jgi:hypothetical protein
MDNLPLWEKSWNVRAFYHGTDVLAMILQGGAEGWKAMNCLLPTGVDTVISDTEKKADKEKKPEGDKPQP